MFVWVIETHDLTKVFRSAWGKVVVAVDGINLRVPSGCVFGFLGPNGAGKTTTLNLLLGNLRPTKGTALLLGHPIGDPEVRRLVGYLPEKFQFHDFLTSEEFLDFHAQLLGVPKRIRKKRIDEVLDFVGLKERRKSKLREFSKGMLQRIGIAQALLNEPRLVILDEPTSALDPLGRREVRDLIVRLKAEGITVFLNSHLLSEVEMTCDAVAIINKGRLVFQGQLKELLQMPTQLDIRFQNPSSKWQQVVASFGEIISVKGDGLSVRVQDEKLIPDLIESLVKSGARLLSVVPKRLSLEDLFVKVVTDEQI
ncbi:MAG: ABC transporter ATP-binding protein [Armatimonadetes bacterium]|nr:ABC transporter ATP-binding protein [Armatimonadota bacterium]MCX7967207.1 ABC transporter ATP-binding protein [Armatimonadota bacterium]MDW8143605.1 ABC transporter ATP-binding protein [Armatimonadota bacterium]